MDHLPAWTLWIIPAAVGLSPVFAFLTVMAAEILIDLLMEAPRTSPPGRGWRDWRPLSHTIAAPDGAPQSEYEPLLEERASVVGGSEVAPELTEQRTTTISGLESRGPLFESHFDRCLKPDAVKVGNVAHINVDLGERPKVQTAAMFSGPRRYGAADFLAKPRRL